MVVLTGNQHVSVGVSAWFPHFPSQLFIPYSSLFCHCSLFCFIVSTCIFPQHFLCHHPIFSDFHHPFSHWLVAFKLNNARKCFHCDLDFIHKAYWDVVPVVVVECGSVDNTDFGTSESISVCITFHDTH